MQFQELTDRQWNMISPHVPKPARTGRPRDDDRRIINGTIYVLTTGCRWGDMPKKYGGDSAANRRLNKWQQKGVWEKILKCAMNSAHSSGKINLQNMSVDSSSVAAKKGKQDRQRRFQEGYRHKDTCRSGIRWVSNFNCS